VEFNDIIYKENMAYYQGKYKVSNPKKYKGDSSDVTYRSGWEKSCFQWCDGNADIIEWSSETIIIPYFYDVDKNYHRYYMDLYIKFKDRTVLVEVKPKKETKAPAKQGKTKQRYLTEAMTFVKNQNKWEAAANYAKDRGWDFEVWTEDELKALGILKTIKSKKKIAPLKKLTPYKRKKKTIK
jgi:hypothetical protein